MDTCHGNHVEMQAMSEIFSRPIEVYQYSIGISFDLLLWKKNKISCFCPKQNKNKKQKWPLKSTRHYNLKTFYKIDKQNINKKYHSVKFHCSIPCHLNSLLYFVDPINTFNKTENEPIRISYHGSVHYNSIVDPFKATIGVGLGLPGLQPGVRREGERERERGGRRYS